MIQVGKPVTFEGRDVGERLKTEAFNKSLFKNQFDSQNFYPFIASLSPLQRIELKVTSTLAKSRMSIKHTSGLPMCYNI